MHETARQCSQIVNEGGVDQGIGKPCCQSKGRFPQPSDLFAKPQYFIDVGHDDIGRVSGDVGGCVRLFLAIQIFVIFFVI